MILEFYNSGDASAMTHKVGVGEGQNPKGLLDYKYSACLLFYPLVPIGIIYLAIGWPVTKNFLSLSAYGH